MKTWLFLNSMGIACVATMLYLVIRQVGLILNRLGPIGARSSDVGPRVGENLVPLVGSQNLVGANGKSTLLIFGSDSCGICGRIKAAVESLVKYWQNKANIVMIYDQDAKSSSQENESLKQGIPMIRSDSMRTKLGIGLVPFGVIVDAGGIVLGKGIVNDISHVESLLELVSNQ